MLSLSALTQTQKDSTPPHTRRARALRRPPHLRCFPTRYSVCGASSSDLLQLMGRVRERAVYRQQQQSGVVALSCLPFLCFSRDRQKCGRFVGCGARCPLIAYRITPDYNIVREGSNRMNVVAPSHFFPPPHQDNVYIILVHIIRSNRYPPCSTCVSWPHTKTTAIHEYSSSNNSGTRSSSCPSCLDLDVFTGGRGSSGWIHPREGILLKFAFSPQLTDAGRSLDWLADVPQSWVMAGPSDAPHHAT